MKHISLIYLATLCCFPKAQEGTLIILNRSDDTADLIDLETEKSVKTFATGHAPDEVKKDKN